VTVDAAASDLPIEFVDVHIRAGTTTILDGVSLTICAGPPTVLVGPNGAGKTTMLRAAMGLIAPAAGDITWGARTEPAQARQAIVFQRPVMLRRSCEANIRYALAAANAPRATRDHRTAELLRLVGLERLAGRPARRLSGGEQHRVALARALARDPAVLFLDEPTASLDPGVTKEIEDIIRAVSARGVKVIMATHDLGEARRLAGEIILVHRGRLLEKVPAEQFFNAPATEAAKRFVAGELLL
jgi:tungstate transport system ATP-binding protein